MDLRIILLSFLLLVLPSTILGQEEWCMMISGKGEGSYYYECYELDEKGRFNYISRSQIHKTIGQGQYYKRPWKIVFVFDTLISPSIFSSQKSEIPEGEIEICRYSLSEELDDWNSKVIYRKDTIHWRYQGIPIRLKYSGGKVQLKYNGTDFMIDPNQDGDNSYAVFWNGPAVQNSIISGDTIVLRRGLLGNYRIRVGLSFNEKKKRLHHKIIVKKFRKR